MRRDDTRAAIYTRISRDAEGLRLGVERQREDLDRLATQLGLSVVGRYEDNDISASTRSSKRRPDYERMLRDARNGVFGRVIAYTSSRLTRRPRENEDLIELAERHGVTFHYLRSPSFDLNTADGRNIARILAANDAAESERIAERVARAARQRAEQGAFHGGTPAFGYVAVKDAAGRTAAWQPHPQHAEWLREAAERLLNGEKLYGICLDWRRQGRQTATGAIWRARTLKRALLSPAVVGLREHEGERFAATWDPVLDRDVWERLHDLLGDESRQLRQPPTREGFRKYTLSGLLRCGHPGCGKLLGSMTKSKGGPVAFFCSKMATGGCGKVRIAMQPLEDWVVEAFFASLDDLTVIQPDPSDAHGAGDDEYGRLRKAIIADQRALDQVNTDHYDGELSRPEWLRQRRRLTDRIEQQRQQLTQLTASTVRAALPAPEELRRQWPERDNQWRRTMLSAAIDHITIAPFPEGMATTLTRRRGETDEQLAKRRAEHHAAILERRVHITWTA